MNLDYFNHVILGAVFAEGTKVAKMTHVRNSERFQDNAIVQKNFGDICLAYQLHIRDKNQIDLQQQREDFEEYETRIKTSHMEIQQQREEEREQYETRVKEALQEQEKRTAELVEEERRKKEAEIDSLKANFDAEMEGLKEKFRNAEQSE
jgi:hypothetical protein